MDAAEAGTSAASPVTASRSRAASPSWRRRPNAEELVERHKKLPRVEAALLRREADALFGGEDRVGEDDPIATAGRR